VTTLLERWPGWRRDDVDALLRRLDSATGDAERDPSLTRREREVAALMKLGMSNRAEVAAWAVRNNV